MVLETFKGKSMVEQLHDKGIPFDEWPDDFKDPANFWKVTCRENQQMFFDRKWRYRYLNAGRATGKTLAAAFGVIEAIDLGYTHIGIVGPTWKHVREAMTEALQFAATLRFGVGGYKYSRIDGWSFTLPWGIATIKRYSAEEPGQLRSPNFDLVWMDEIREYKGINYSLDEEVDSAIHNVREAARQPGPSGKPVRIIITSTPIGFPNIRYFIEHPRSLATTMSTYENAANLDELRLEEIVEGKGTRRYRQEVEAELLDDVEGAMWIKEDIKVLEPPDLKTFDRIIISVDPAGSTTRKADFTGISVVGRREKQGWVLDSGHFKMNAVEWAKIVVKLYHDYKIEGVPIKVIAESNYGGNAWSSVIQQADDTIPVEEFKVKVNKWARAEPIRFAYGDAELDYSNRRIFHAKEMNELVAEMTQFTQDWNEPGKHDDILDSVVNGLTYLGFADRMKRVDYKKLYGSEE